MFDATFWVAISFIAFCLILIYKKIPQLINKLLEDKINEIKSEIENTKNLKIENYLISNKNKILDALLRVKIFLLLKKKKQKIL